MAAIPVIMDCDPGHDDAIALVMAAKSETIHLLGVTAVFGNSPIQNTARNAMRVLEYLGLRDVPFAVGADRPIARKFVMGTADGVSGLDGSPYLPEPTMKPVPGHAVDFLASLLLNAESPVTLVPTGPLTNIALLCMKYPEALKKIKEIVLMGGAFLRKTRYVTATEFNIVSDPVAASIVAESGVPVTFVGLDVTMSVLVEEREFSRLKAVGNELSELIQDWCSFYEKLHRSTMGVGGALHDPLALAYVIDKTLLETEQVFLDIEQQGSCSFGATVADFWHPRRKASNIRVATNVDSGRFFDLLIRLVSK